MSSPFIWKPYSEGGLNKGGLSVVLPAGGKFNGAKIIGSKGQVVDTLKKSPYGGEYTKFYSGKSGASYGNDLKVQVDTPDGPKYYNIAQGGMRYEGGLDDGENLTAMSGGYGGGSNGMAGGFSPGQAGQYGFYPAYLGDQFPDPKRIRAPRSRIGPIETAPYQFTDPMEFAKQYGDFNMNQMRSNFGAAQDLALRALDTELAGLRQFTPAASALKRSEISLDNQFNQSQRLSQFDQAVGGGREALQGQADRAQAFAEGRLPDSIDDRAYELGIRSRAADNANAGGFGAGSNVSRKASDLMSAEARVGLSQYGDSLLSNNINQRANLLMAPTEYSNAGSQINVTPSISGSQLTSAYASELNQNTTINPTNALSSQIQQEQYATNLETGNRQFNQSNAIQQREFNIGNKMAARQFNANNINQFAMAKFQYDVGYAATVAGAAQTNSNTEVALAQQQQYGQIFQGAMGQAQQSNQVGSIAQGIGAFLPVAAQAVQGIASLFGGGSSTGSPSVELPSAPIASGSPAGVTAQPVSTPSGVYPSGESYGAPQGSVIVPAGSPAPSGYSGSGGMSVEGPSGGGAVYVPDSYVQSQGAAFSGDTGIDLRSTITNDPQRGVTQALLQSNSVMRSAGFSDSMGPGMQQVSYSSQGQPRYASSSLLNSNDASMGQSLAGTVKDVLSPLGVFSQKEDATGFDKISAAAGDLSLISQLGALQQSGDTKGFMNVLLNKFQKPTIEALTDDPSNQAGLASAFSAYNLYQNWGEMSPAQKGLGVATMGIQGYQFANGDNLANKYLVSPSKGSPGLTVGQGMGLFQAGINTYSLVKNWDQMNTIQKLASGTGTVSQIASLAKQFGFLGSGTSGAAVGGVTQASLQASGWATAPHLGVGAITSQTGSALPQGFTTISTAADGSTVAVPTATAASSQGVMGAGSLLNTAAGVAGIGAGAYALYKGWGKGGGKGAINGALGGSAMAGGLYALGATNPFLLGGVVAASALSGMIKTGKQGDQNIRDDVRSSFQSKGLLDKDYNLALADGSKAYLGDDGHSGEHEVRDPSMLSEGIKNHTGKLHSYDIDYTNDLDFVAGMGGMALSRIIGGSADKHFDQMGGQLGNASIKNIGFGKDMTASNFTKMAENQRAMYSKSGIKSKADAYQLSNQMFAEGRIDETQLVSMQQSFNMIYDKDGYSTAQKLMSGRQHGVQTALKNPTSPSKTSQDSPLTQASMTKESMAALNSGKYNGQPIVPYNSKQTFKGGKVPALSRDAIRQINAQRYNVNTSQVAA